MWHRRYKSPRTTRATGDIFPDRRVVKQRWNSLHLCGGRRLRCGDPHLAFISHISPGPAFEKTADFMETSRKLGLILHSTRHTDLIITATQQSGRLYISPSTALVLRVMQEGVGWRHPRKVRFISRQITWSFILLSYEPKTCLYTMMQLTCLPVQSEQSFSTIVPHV